MDSVEEVVTSSASKKEKAPVLPVASSSDSRSSSLTPPPYDEVDLPDSPTSPRFDQTEDMEDEFVGRSKLSGLAGFLSTSAGGSSVESQASSNFFDLVSASSPASSIAEEDVCMENDLAEKEEVVEDPAKTRRRLPGEGGSREL